MIKVYQGLLMDLQDPGILFDKDLFITILQMSIEILDVAPVDIADSIGSSSCYVKDWAKGLIYPSSHYQERIIFCLIDYCKWEMEALQHARP